MFQFRGRDLDADLRSSGRPAFPATLAKSGEVSRRKAKIDPEVRKRDKERKAKQLQPYGQKCPEYAGVAELAHPQLLLYPAGDDSQERDEYDCCKNDEFQRTPPPEDAVISCSSMPFDSRQPCPLAMCWSLDHCSTSFPMVRDTSILLLADPPGSLTLRSQSSDRAYAKGSWPCRRQPLSHRLR